ncbi:hypothetical protein ASG37_16450 [Sphingomonas sp. Leaf407]|uniref:acyltransferase family protein n=1 Tax=unclassified Sphingomonas TaxID=196159 RepID=UPI0006F54E6A|nr:MULTISPECIES: acyltransferase [unclassified Sphingomonas]KQN33741.1 hypothetical protein ASE97_16440 [Sphingomonas sp. Leaf42]KQT25022.1 hypothetical protein ASG37_16450 [Sphingomonas sp. Leaf407]
MTKTPRLLVNVQIARLLAALLVVVHHADHELIQTAIAGWQDYRPWFRFDGSLGVDVFFVISGLIMVLTSGNSFGSVASVRHFLTRRLVRIVPLYWIFTMLMLVAMWFLPGRVAHSQSGGGQIVASLLFWPMQDMKGLIQPILGVGWTLNYEMFFYVAFGLALLLPRRTGLVTIFASFTLLVLAGQVLPADAPDALRFWSGPIILEFLFGMIVGLGLQRGWRIGGATAVLMMVVGVTLLWLASDTGLSSTPWRWLVGGIPASLIVAGAAMGPQAGDSAGVRMLRLGGDASYALYLSHPFAINIVSVIWQKLPLVSPAGYIAATVIVSLATGVLVHLLVERPILDILHQRPIALMKHPMLFFWKRTSASK